METITLEKAELTDEVERYSQLVEKAELFASGRHEPPGTGDSYFLKGFEFLRVQEVNNKLSDDSIKKLRILNERISQKIVATEVAFRLQRSAGWEIMEQVRALVWY